MIKEFINSSLSSLRISRQRLFFKKKKSSKGLTLSYLDKIYCNLKVTCTKIMTALKTLQCLLYLHLFILFHPLLFPY